MTNDEVKKNVEAFALSHDSMRLPYDWLKYVPCRYEIYYTSQTDDGTKYANIFLYHDEQKKEG